MSLPALSQGFPLFGGLAGRRTGRQHAASFSLVTLIAHAFSGERSLKALGTYNFAGVIGKITIVPVSGASLLFLVLS